MQILKFFMSIFHLKTDKRRKMVIRQKKSKIESETKLCRKWHLTNDVPSLFRVCMDGINCCTAQLNCNSWSLLLKCKCLILKGLEISLLEYMNPTVTGSTYIHHQWIIITPSVACGNSGMLINNTSDSTSTCLHLSLCMWSGSWSNSIF